jgi:multifunctional methyltransferase subunit TRM112
MRLLTHNLLACHARSCTQTSNNFPLECRQVKLETLETEYNDAFLRGFLPKLDWSALVKTARELGDTSLPDQSPDINDPMMDEEVLKKLHHVLLEVRFISFSLIDFLSDVLFSGAHYRRPARVP